MAAFPSKGKNALLNAMQKLVDNYTVDRDIYIYGDRQKKIIYTLGGYVTKDTTGICWHNPFNLGNMSVRRVRSCAMGGLTDEEIHDMSGYEEDRKMYRFARDVEAKLKEKNT
jgi:hypothetical protein